MAMASPLTPELERIVADKVASGDYDSPTDVLRAALELLLDKESDRERRLSALRRKVAAGIADADAGRLAPLDVEDIKRRARERAGL